MVNGGSYGSGCDSNYNGAASSDSDGSRGVCSIGRDGDK